MSEMCRRMRERQDTCRKTNVRDYHRTVSSSICYFRNWHVICPKKTKCTTASQYWSGYISLQMKMTLANWIASMTSLFAEFGPGKLNIYAFFAHSERMRAHIVNPLSLASFARSKTSQVTHVTFTERWGEQMRRVPNGPSAVDVGRAQLSDGILLFLATYYSTCVVR